MTRLVLGWFAGALFVLELAGGANPVFAQVPEAQPVPAENVVHDAPETGQPPSDDEAARRHFRLGQAYYQNGQFPEAAEQFEQAYQLSGRPQLLYNIYLAHRDALHTRHSYEALRQYLDEVADPPDEDHLRARLHHLEEALAANPELDDPVVEPDTQTPDQPPVPDTTPEPDLSATEEPETSSPVPWVIAGAGGGVLVGGLAAALISRGARSDLDALCEANGACPPESNWESLRDKGHRSAIAADVLIGVGAATAVTGVVLFFVMRPTRDEDERASAEDAQEASVRGGFGCTATGCMATLGGQF